MALGCSISGTGTEREVFWADSRWKSRHGQAGTADTVMGKATGLPSQAVPEDSLLPGPDEPTPGRHLPLAGAPGAGAPHAPPRGPSQARLCYCEAGPAPAAPAPGPALPPWAFVFVVPSVLSQGRPLRPVRAVAQDAASAPRAV